MRTSLRIALHPATLGLLAAALWLQAASLPGADGLVGNATLTVGGAAQTFVTRPVVAGWAEYIGVDTDFAYRGLTSSLVFADGFESGWTFFWSAAVVL